jgi:hypothetical protein
LQEAELPKQVLAILQRYASGMGFHLWPNIPPKKLAKAKSKVTIPADETILGLVDCSSFGTASDSLLFGSQGFYYHHSVSSRPNPGTVSYATFPTLEFATCWLWCISLGKDHYCNMMGADINIKRGTIIAILNAIRDEVIQIRNAPK